MIPGKILRFLQDHANVAFAGTRDQHLVPHGHRVSAWHVDADGRTMTALIPEHFTNHLVESLEHNGEFALTVEEFPSHETYQFKGRYLRHRPILAGDLARADRVRERFVNRVVPLYADGRPDLLRAFVPKPSIAIEFEVLEIYLQTPGPGAGARLAPAGEA